MCRWLFPGFTEIWSGRHRSTRFFFLGGGVEEGGGVRTAQKKIWSIFINFNIAFPATWGWARFKIQNGRQRSTPTIFFVGTKTPRLKVRNYSHFLSHSPQYGDMQVFFFTLLKFKMAAMDKLFFWRCKNWKIEVSNNSHFTITLPTIWECAVDFTEI